MEVQRKQKETATIVWRGGEERWEELREHEKNLSFDRLLQCLQKYSQI